ncbi:MAG: LysE family transporter [Flavobacteriales bacterium]|nr:LysE family transporter [Flavobacteriales bacterium]MCB9336025.1 LysE family transporter [Flavobacteriales bacterium]
MEHLALIGSVVLIHLMAVMSPGPDFFMALRNSLTYSRKTGIYTAIGFGLGIGVHVVYCVFGLALIISKSILVFNIIKFLGAAYIIYVGVMSLISKSNKIEMKTNEHKTDISPIKAIRIGFLTNVLNPKATLFFLSLFTFVISPETPNHIMILLGVIMMVNTAIWFSLVAVFFTQKRIQRFYNQFQRIFNRIFGSILIAIGIKIIFSK